MRSCSVSGSSRSVLAAVLCAAAIPLVLLAPTAPRAVASEAEAATDQAALKPCQPKPRPLLSVSKDVPPRFQWSPRCGVSELLVEEERNSLDVWVVETPGETGIAPGIVYGSVPDGAAERGTSVPLKAGGHYRVTLRSWRPSQPEHTWIVTSAPFVAGEGGPTNPIPGPECGRNVRITVLPEKPPRFTWEPPCRVHELHVSRAGKDVWVVGAPLEVGIEPGIAYGETPEGGHQIEAPPPLNPGETYRVSLRRRVPDFRTGRFRHRVQVGKQDFVP